LAIAGSETARTPESITNFHRERDAASISMILNEIHRGRPLARESHMAGLHDFRDFAAWQRAEELRMLVESFLARPGLSVRFRRAQQLSDAAASAPRNIAEGLVDSSRNSSHSSSELRRVLRLKFSTSSSKRDRPDCFLVRTSPGTKSVPDALLEPRLA
jgi:hypothetical protein